MSDDLIVKREKAKVFPEENSPYEMTIVDIRNFEREKFNSPGEMEEVFRIEFLSDYKEDPNEDPWTYTWFISKSLNKRSNLFKLASAALGSEFDPNAESFDASTLIGKTVRLILKTQLTRDGSHEYSKVDSILPSKSSKEKSSKK